MYRETYLLWKEATSNMSSDEKEVFAKEVLAEAEKQTGAKLLGATGGAYIGNRAGRLINKALFRSGIMGAVKRPELLAGSIAMALTAGGGIAGYNKIKKTIKKAED
jgi:hypothetical protein